MYSDLSVWETPCLMHNLHHIIRWEGRKNWPILPVCQGQSTRLPDEVITKILTSDTFKLLFGVGEFVI